MRINIGIQTINNIRVDCVCRRRNESSPFGRVIPGVAVIQAGIVIEVIPSVTDGIRVGDGGIGRAGSNGAIACTYILPNLPPAVKKKPPRP